MGQITIYLDDETERKLQATVEKSGMSKSSWIAGLIKEKTSQVWPEHIKRLAGAWKDFPDSEEIRKGLAHDAAREPM
jgi:predicted transcriptional regulator